MSDNEMSTKKHNFLNQKSSDVAIIAQCESNRDHVSSRPYRNNKLCFFVVISLSDINLSAKNHFYTKNGFRDNFSGVLESFRFSIGLPQKTLISVWVKKKHCYLAKKVYRKSTLTTESCS